MIRPFFREPFGEGSRRTPISLTPLARVLDAIVRRTLLPRLGYREGLTRMQLWVVHHLISQTPFDIWDLMLCEMEDTLTEGFKGHWQLSYAHWICFLIRSACDLPAEIRAEISDTTTAFPEYDIRQLWASVTREQAPGPGQRQRLEVPETAAKHDETVEGLTEAELADLDAQPADPVEEVTTDSTNEDYQPIPWYRSPRPHDYEAGGSGSASRSDPAMVAILERLTQAQERHEVQMQRQAQDTAAAFAQIQARHDEF
jgi:hypothetical protein